MKTLDGLAAWLGKTTVTRHLRLREMEVHDRLDQQQTRHPMVMGLVVTQTGFTSLSCGG